MKHTLLVITLLIGSFQFIGQSKEWKVMAKKDVTYKHEDDKIMHKCIPNCIFLTTFLF